jgi:hypothetical protein
MKTIARLVTRDDGNNDGSDGLILGARLRGDTFFKPGRVYEVIECLGEVTIKDIGPSCIPKAGTLHVDSPVGYTWANSLTDIMAGLSKYVYLTAQEFKSLVLGKERE